MHVYTYLCAKFHVEAVVDDELRYFFSGQKSKFTGHRVKFVIVSIAFYVLDIKQTKFEWDLKQNFLVRNIIIIITFNTI